MPARKSLRAQIARLHFQGGILTSLPGVTTTADYIASGFSKMDRDIVFLSECLREVLLEMGESTAAASLPWVGDPLGSEAAMLSLRGLEQSYSIAFQLLNMVEENAAARTRRLREQEHGIGDEPGLWGQQLRRLIRNGFSESEIAAFLPRVRVEPVLTAHPTEAKRSAVLEQHREIFAHLTSLENPLLTPSEQRRFREKIKSVLERLWRTGEILLQKPDVASERRSVNFYLREVFPLCLKQLDERLRRAWESVGFDPAILDQPAALPRIRFGTWVGGDRDGHPLVTADVTRESLLDLRLAALEVLDRKLRDLASALPLSGVFRTPPEALLASLDSLSIGLGSVADEIASRYPDEPWRRYVLLMRAKLPLEARPTDRSRIREGENRYRFATELDEDLRVLEESLVEIGAVRLAKDSVAPVRRALSVFGFHLAVLDIRQNSRFHDEALGQILEASGQNGADFAEWDEERRLAFLICELESPRPFLYHDSGIGPQADAVLSCYRVLNRYIRNYGHAGIGSLIVSMTRRVSDLLVVYVLLREAGLMRWENGELVSELAVVPLFETLEDLEASPQLMEEFLSHPVTRRSLEYQRQLRNHGDLPVQQIMIGYSDSNKDCGIFASQWALSKSQTVLTDLSRAIGVRLRFFHGRGGTISRGAGPTHRFLDALPSGSIQADLRLTEQGETIAQKYANLDNATYNLELLVAGVAGVSLAESRPSEEDLRISEICNLLARTSTEAYQELIRMEGFMAFYSEATPIGAVEVSSIGSRPARRTGKRTLADLRAIPWVFSWNQSRFYLPGWFGVGHALEHLSQEAPEEFAYVCAKLKDSAFLYYVLTNVETNLASADISLMRSYAGLVEDVEVRDRIFSHIEAEFLRTQRMMSEVFGGSIERRRPRMLRTLGLRADALLALHRKQIEVLARWRAARRENEAEAAALLPPVLLSINAIASGLRTTG